MTLKKINIRKIKFVKPSRGLIGFIDFTVNDEFGFDQVAVFHRLAGGIRLAWPEKKIGLETVHSAYPVSKEFSDAIEQEILKALQKAMPDLGKVL